MTIIIPIGLISLIIAAFVIAKSQNEKNRVLQKKLELTSNNDDYSINTFNKSDFRSTSISEENGILTFNTDIQIIQITTNGKLKLRVSSLLDSIPIKFELLTKFNPSIIDSSYINKEIIDNTVAFPYKNEEPLNIITFLKNNYELEVGQISYSPCIGIKYDKILINKSRKTIELTGLLKDMNKWEIYIDYDKNRMRIKLNQASIKDINNFPQYRLV